MQPKALCTGSEYRFFLDNVNRGVAVTSESAGTSECEPLHTGEPKEMFVVLQNKGSEKATPRHACAKHENVQQCDDHTLALSSATHRQFLAFDTLPLHEETTDESNATSSDRKSVSSRDRNIISLQHGW